MKRLLFTVLIALAGCGGGPDPNACHCTGDVPGGHLDIGCGESKCLNGIGYYCAGANTAVPNDGVCSNVGGFLPDLGTGNNNNASKPDMATPVNSNCVEGTSCQTDECNYGSMHCEPTRSVCIVQGNFSDGTACSTGTCQSGLCESCVGGASCTDGCHEGYQICNGSQATCQATSSLPNGTSCGTSMICSAGTCTACTAGASCDTGNPCYDGVVSCTNGYSCQQTLKANGTACGSGKVCYFGTCQACVDGSACTPSGTCHTGKLSCSTGTSTCMDLGGTVPDGTQCSGSTYYCKSATCSYCAQGVSCTSANPCKTATTQCATGTGVCTDSGNKTDGTSCGTNQVCLTGACTACTAGVACTPTNPCHKGLTSCSTGVSVCVDQSTSAADGTSCGTNMVCKTGMCGACTAGASCSTGDPCQTGKTECTTGAPVCVPSGATAATTCGNVTKGTCSSGACSCPAGTGFYMGDCQACPGSATTSGIVSANPSVGSDNQCCGRTNSAGLGGPCYTLKQAMANNYSTVTLAGNSLGNLSANETYPIAVKSGLTLNGSVCVPGVSGKDVFDVSSPGGLALNGQTVGADCQGHASAASEGVHVGPGSSLTTTATTITGVTNGVHVDGGTVNVGTLAIHNVSGDGIVCRSDTTPAQTSQIYLDNDFYPYYYAYNADLSIYAAAQHDILASTGCTLNFYYSASLELGDAPPCPANKRDQFGLYAEGNANVSLTYATVRASCMAQDGLSLRNNAALTTNAPTVTLSNATFTHNGCAGVYAEVGKVTLSGGSSTHNHWGVVQHSNASSSTATDYLISASGTQFVCNTKNEPGACSASGVGAQIFNDSGLPLSAAGNSFNDAVVDVCNCNSAISSCTCTGGATTPPDGVDVLNAPLSAGTPTTNVTSFTPVTVDCTKQ